MGGVARREAKVAEEDGGVADHPDESRFVFAAEGAEAELVYRQEGDRLILIHTGVPESLGGRGIGGQLVQFAVQRAAREGLTMVPWCPYARRWLSEHPDVAGAASIDWDTPPPSD